MRELETYYLQGFELESPLVAAAGTINGPHPERILKEFELLADTAIGAITFGSFTVPPQEGNEAKFGPPVYWHDKTSGKTYNSMGLPNIGKAAAVELAPKIIKRAYDMGKLVIYSGSPTNHPQAGDSIEQAAELAYDFLKTGIDAVEINVSCPNVVTAGGGRKPIMGYDLETMHDFHEAMMTAVGENQNLGLKLPPYLSDEERVMVPDIAKILRSRRVFNFLVTSNTIPNQIALDVNGRPILSVPGGKGGASGPAYKAEGREQLNMWREQMGDETEIISTLGVDSGAELAARLKLGAVAAGGVSFLWESANWPATISQLLTDFAFDAAEPTEV